MSKIYCNSCKKQTEHNQKLDAVKSGMEVCSICSKMNSRYLLLKPTDPSFKKISADIKWIEFDEIGRFKYDYKEPGIGRSLLMSPFNDGYSWLTTITKEVIEQNDEFILFNTENSEYKLMLPK